MFDFSDLLYYDQGGKLFDVIFEKKITEWYDAGKPDNNFNEIIDSDGIYTYIIYNFEPVDTIEGESNRWTKWVDCIYEFRSRYFRIGYEAGLTEMQDNSFDYSDMEEVNKVSEWRLVTEWQTKI